MKIIEVTQEIILDLYSKYVLRHNHPPVNIYTFCEENEFSEAQFYRFYTSFDQLEADYLNYFFQQSLQLISAEENYFTDDARTRVLSFYYTFFEQLTMNRSLVMYLIGPEKDNLKSFKKLWSVKKEFQQFINSLDISEPLMEAAGDQMAKMQRYKEKGVAELFWGHFITTLKFWMQDTSPNFEKTDVFIEKSVDTSFSLLEVQPLKKLLDLGKFIFNEKIKK